MRQPLTMRSLASAVTGAAFSILISTAGTVRADDALDAFNRVSASNFDSGGAISRQFHLNAESYLRSTTIASGERPHKLPLQHDPTLASLEVTTDGATLPFADYVAQDELLDGVIVLHNGAIAFEAYPNMAPRQRHYAWSVTKVLTSATLASLVAEGLVDMQAPVENYVGELAGTAWAGTSVQHIADMASGIDCRDRDGYQDTSTCVYRMEASLGITASKGEPESFIAVLQGMSRHRPAGTRSEYVSANTNVLMLVIESVTGKPYADVVRTRIWEPVGAKADALMSVSAEGHAYASGGLSAKLRDIARFGRVFIDGKQFSGINAPMLADLRGGGGIAISDENREWLRDSYGDDLPVRAGWQWDAIWDDGAMLKEGYLGQALYVDPARDLVIAWFGTGVDYSAQITAMPAVARQLSRSGLFDLHGGTQ